MAFPLKLVNDIKRRWLIHAKGLLFVALGALSAMLLFLQLPTFKTAALLCVTVWAFCRFYYYLFYVLERYLGREKRFTGVLDVLRFLLWKSTQPNRARANRHCQRMGIGRDSSEPPLLNLAEK